MTANSNAEKKTDVENPEDLRVEIENVDVEGPHPRAGRRMDVVEPGLCSPPRPRPAEMVGRENIPRAPPLGLKGVIAVPRPDIQDASTGDRLAEYRIGFPFEVAESDPAVYLCPVR